MQEWCGVPEESIRNDLLLLYLTETHKTMSYDKELPYVYQSIITEIACLQKANYIHL